MRIPCVRHTLSSLVALLVALCTRTPAQIVHSTSTSVSVSTKVAFATRHFAFLADEATTGVGGTDLNADGDVVDAIAIVVDMQTTLESSLAVATADLAWIGDELYVVADEAQDSTDWNGDSVSDDAVLLHWSPAASALAFVDTLASAGTPKMVAVGNALFYASDTPPMGALSSSLRYVTTGQPLVPTMVPTVDVMGGLAPRILGQDEGLLFLTLDESVEGRDLNRDADAVDASVLALCDGTASAPVVRSTALALPGSASPLRARKTSAHDWNVGLLVSEAAQGSTNLNDPSLFAGSWQAPQCTGQGDFDTLDDVLHYLQFAAWNSNPTAAPIRNTGLVGSRKIAIASGFVATISPEPSEGTCDLNQDGDRLDHVVRYVRIVPSPAAVLPVNAFGLIHAVFDAPGGSHGLCELTDRFVVTVSESADDHDIDGDGLKTFDLLGWLLPQMSSTAWDFTHGSAGDFVGVSWMSEQLDRARLSVAFEERVFGVSINAGDTDLLDSVPTFATFTSGTTLSFPGVAIALDNDNAGISVVGNEGYYRVSEAEDSRDWNQDADAADMILWRTSLTLGTSSAIGTLNGLARSAIETSFDPTTLGVAFLSDESSEGPGGTDMNADGDATDFVVRWVRMSADCNQNGVLDDVDIATGTSSDCNGNLIPDECDIASSSSSDVNADGIPDECQSGGTGFCSGDGSGTPCPCFGFGSSGNGCPNSSIPSGAHLAASGLPSVVADSLALEGSGMPSTSTALYFQGTAQQSGGAGAVFGDGLRCAAGTIIRLAIKTNALGASRYPSAGDAPISVRGLIPNGGGVSRTYQTWYRNSAPFCTPSTFNLTNGVLMQWVH